MIKYFKDIPIEEHHLFKSSSVHCVKELRYKRHLGKALEDLKELLRSRGVHAYKLRNTYHEELWWIVQNVSYCIKTRATYFSYDRSERYYKGMKVSFTQLLKVLDLLEEEGLVDLYIGCSYAINFNYITVGEKGIKSRVKPTGILKIVEKYHNKGAPKIKLGGSIEIRKRDTKEPISMMDEGGVSLLQDLLDEYNKYLEGVIVTLDGEPLTVHQYNKIYTDNLEGGGRYYLNIGGSQNIPKELRCKLEIDGSGVAELDYSAMHPRVLYELAFKEDPQKVRKHLEEVCKTSAEDFDPYSDGNLLKLLPNRIKEFEDEFGYEPNTVRNFMKKALLVAMNSESPTKAKMSLAYAIRNDKALWDENPKMAEFYGLDLVDLDKVIEYVKLLNEPISGSLFAGNSLYLQHIDASIMDKIVLYAMQVDKPILPMHDGVICKEEDLGYIKHIMELAWGEQLGGTSFCKIKREY